jgi:hypothetical protein
MSSDPVYRSKPKTQIFITEKQLNEIKANQTVVCDIYAFRKINAPRTHTGAHFTIYLTEDDFDVLSNYGYYSTDALLITVLVTHNKHYRFYDVSIPYSPYVPVRLS